ncbi:NUMOD3 domain-containing DNA-binding protein [Rhizobium leguminosarum]|uniref:NUMOD3 domain-containing DNA-binding protein n=1 Tax=Rhizobium leguminosarum TaxID=384 RepID=UPI0015DAEAD4|nr:NUMOD3 domain-containing DNA-binding protein [Rhizobium leguminosarum]NZD50521.1 hypothetical protein [Rhizobium leguminosarum]
MTKLPTGRPVLPFTPTVDTAGDPTTTTSSSKMFYTYVWRDNSGAAFYVGKGVGKRAFNTSQRSRAFGEVYKRGGCTVEIVDYFIHESQAHAHEMELIDFYGRRDNGTGELVNLTDGGEGASGWLISDETREKIGKAARGRTLSAEHRAKISEGNRGKKLSPEHIAILIEANLGRVHSEKTKAKSSAAKRGNQYALGTVRSPETRVRISASKRGIATRIGVILSQEVRAKIAASLRGRPLSEEHRAKLSKFQRGRPKSPEHVASVSDALHMCPPRADSSSGFKGVSANRTTWVARITIGGKRRTIGYFPTANDAAHAYDEAAIEAWGLGNCYLNFAKVGGCSA